MSLKTGFLKSLFHAWGFLTSEFFQGFSKNMQKYNLEQPKKLHVHICEVTNSTCEGLQLNSEDFIYYTVCSFRIPQLGTLQIYWMEIIGVNLEI